MIKKKVKSKNFLALELKDGKAVSIGFDAVFLKCYHITIHNGQSQTIFWTTKDEAITIGKFLTTKRSGKQW